METQKQEITDVHLVCMILLTFNYAQTESKKNFTSNEMFERIENFFNVTKERVVDTLEAMCSGNICGKWQRNNEDGSTTVHYTKHTFVIKEGVLRVLDEQPE